MHWLARLGPEPPHTGTRDAYVSPASPTARRLCVSGDERLTLLELGSTAVVFDGELHDGPRKVVGSAAAEWVLRAYLDTGTAFLATVRGAFTLIIWDWGRDALVGARDPMGVQPLFYAKSAGTLQVSPSPERLVDGTAVSPSVNRQAVGAWVIGDPIEWDETFYESVKRLPPGHRLEAVGGAVRAVRSWLPELGEGRGRSIESFEAVETFETLLELAVARSFGAGRAAVHISGGVDSAAVAAAAVRVSRERALPPPLALSLKFPIEAVDEGPAQRAVAAALGLEHLVIPLGEACGPSLLRAGLRKSADSWLPCVNPWATAWDFLRGRAHELGCAAVLGGEGGNDWLEVGWAWAADLLLGLDVRRLRALLESERAFRGRPMGAELLWRHGLRLIARDAVEPRLRRAAPALVRKAYFIRQSRRRLPAWALPDSKLRRELMERRAARPPVSRLAGSFARGDRRRLLESPHFSVFLESQAQAAVESGAPARHPLHDPDLVEFLSCVQPELLNMGGEVKGLARVSLRKRLGPQVVRLLSAPYADPVVAEALAREGSAALEALGGTPLLGELGIVDEWTFSSAVTSLGNVASDGYGVWEALACEAWLQTHLRTTTGGGR